MARHGDARMGLTKEVDKEYNVPAPAPWVIPLPEREQKPEQKPVIVAPEKEPELVPA